MGIKFGLNTKAVLTGNLLPPPTTTTPPPPRPPLPQIPDIIRIEDKELQVCYPKDLRQAPEPRSSSVSPPAN